MKGNYKYSDNTRTPLLVIILTIGTIVSLSFMFFAGRNNSSFILMSLFTAWVISPFAAMFVAIRKPFISAKQLNYLVPVIVIGSIIFYLVAYFFPGKTPAFIFLLIPFVSWVIIVIVALLNKRKKANT